MIGKLLSYIKLQTQVNDLLIIPMNNHASDRVFKVRNIMSSRYRVLFFVSYLKVVQYYADLKIARQRKYTYKPWVIHKTQPFHVTEDQALYCKNVGNHRSQKT